MTIARKHSKLIFRKTERELSRLCSTQDTEAVHRFRTTVLRLETMLEQFSPGRHRKPKKLLKRLIRIRKGAGKVRDIDVQLAMLRSLKMPLEPRRKRQLAQGLLELRAKHESGLRKMLKKSDIREVRKRLARAAKEVTFEARVDPLAIARQMLQSVPVSPNPADENTLLRFRRVVKRARYAAEFARASTESKLLIAQLKRLEDVIGHWQDWCTLTHTAIGRLGDVTQSSLVAALNTVTRAQFRHAVAAVSAAKTAALARNGVEQKSTTKAAAAVERPGAKT